MTFMIFSLDQAGREKMVRINVTLQLAAGKFISYYEQTDEQCIQAGLVRTACDVRVKLAEDVLCIIRNMVWYSFMTINP